MATGAMNERARQAIAGTHFVDLHGRPSGRLSSVFVGREPRRDYTPVVRTATGNQAPEFEPQGSGSRNPTPGPSTLTGKLQGKLPILNRRRLTGRKRRRSSSASLEHDLFSNSKSPQSAGHHGPRPVPAVPLALHGSTPSLYDCTDTETRRRRRDEAVASQRSQDYGSEHFGTESPRRPVTLADQQGSRSDTSPANPSAGRNSRATLIRGVVPAASAARAKSARRLSRKPAAHMRDAEWTEEYEPAPADSVGVITLASTRERRIVLSVEDTTAASADISSAANDLADSSDGSDSDDSRSGYGDAAIARSISEDSSVSDINRSAGRRVMDSVVIERRISGQSLLRPLNTLRPVAFDPSEESGPDECDIPRSSREGPKTRQNSPIYLPFMPMNREARTFQREGAPEVMSHIGSGEGRPAGSTSSGVAGVAGPDEQGQIMRIDHVSSGSAGGSENTTNTSAIMHLPNDHRRDSNVNSTQADGANRAPAEIRGFVNRAVEHREQDTVRHRSPPIERQQPDRLATSVRGTTHGELRGTETRCASCRIPKRPTRSWRGIDVECTCCNVDMFDRWYHGLTGQRRLELGQIRARLPIMSRKWRLAIWPDDINDFERVVQVGQSTKGYDRHLVAPFAFQRDGRPYNDFMFLKGEIDGRPDATSAAPPIGDVSHGPGLTSVPCALQRPQPLLADHEPLWPGEDVCDCCGQSSITAPGPDGSSATAVFPGRRRRIGWRAPRT